MAIAGYLRPQPLAANVPQVRLPQQRLHRRSALAAVDEPLEHREVVEQPLRAHVGVDAELLRQVAERAAHRVLLPHHVDVAQ